MDGRDAANDPVIVEEAGGVRLRVRLQPGASKTELAGELEGALKLKVQAPPVEGAANAAALKFLAKLLGVAKGRVELVRGQRSRDKVFFIRGLDAASVRQILEER